MLCLCNRYHMTKIVSSCVNMGQRHKYSKAPDRKYAFCSSLADIEMYTSVTKVVDTANNSFGLAWPRLQMRRFSCTSRNNLHRGFSRHFVVLWFRYGTIVFLSYIFALAYIISTAYFSQIYLWHVSIRSLPVLMLSSFYPRTKNNAANMTLNER